MQEYVEAMQPGWNLGNSLDATPNETAWGNPPTTRELIHQVKAQGFKSIRIPVTWDQYVGSAPDYKVDPAWMNRVEEVVDWALDEGLYVMLNMHHDSYWLRRLEPNYRERFLAIWAQIAERFRDHPRELMLESINEPIFDNVDAATSMALLRDLNVAFFNLVRSSGGGNQTRPLVLPTLETNAGQQYLDSLKATMLSLNDTNLIATNHYYGYWQFSVNNSGVVTVNQQVVDDIEGALTRAHDTFVADGIPVVIGEVGILSYNPYLEIVERGEMLKYFELFVATARATGITWQVWDAGGMFDRYTFKWKDPELTDYLMAGLSRRSSTAATDLIFVKTNLPSDVSVSLNLNGNSCVGLTDGTVSLTEGDDYVLNGSTLTIKGHVFAQYASGSYGQKTTLSVQFSAGQPWSLRVHHQATSHFAASYGNKKDGLTIPVAFNGDLVATMEAAYLGKGFPYPGKLSWTSFEQYNEAFLPNYATNSFLLYKEFFAASTNDPVELTFHMWSGRKLKYQLTYESGADMVSNPETLDIYNDTLAAGWNDGGSWASHDFSASAAPHSGSAAISVDAGGYGGLVLTNGGAAVDTSGYRTLVFWVHGGSSGGQLFGVRIERDGNSSSPGVAIPTPKANTWTKVEIPLSSLGVEGSPNCNRIIFQNWTNASAPTLYIDDLHFTTAYASDMVFVHGTPVPVVTSPLVVQATEGTPFSYTVEADAGADALGVSGLPSWLHYNPSTKTVTGIPPLSGDYSFTIEASNNVGVLTEEVAVRVLSGPVLISFPDGIEGESPTIEVPYDGNSHAVSIRTQPEGIPLTVTYDGGSVLPRLPGRYRVHVSPQDPNLAGAAEADLLITSSDPGRLVNLSVRAYSGTDSEILIMGFVTHGGTTDASLLVRGIGPTLRQYGLNEGLLEDPSLAIFKSTDLLLANSDWDSSLTPLFDQTGAFTLPAMSFDAALSLSMPAGLYTAQVQGQNGGTGVALGEVYDLNTQYNAAAPTLVNASARCRVGTGDSIVVPGFVIGGSTPLRVLIRAVGPSLSEFGVEGVLENPQITLFRGTEPIGSNDNWDSSLAPTFAKVGAFTLPLGSNDAALVVELAPGLYTAQVSGANGSTGVALVELYVLPGL